MVVRLTREDRDPLISALSNHAGGGDSGDSISEDDDMPITHCSNQRRRCLDLFHGSFLEDIGDLSNGPMNEKLDEKAPPVRLDGIDGKIFDSTELNGRRYLLSFFRFASCPFCTPEFAREKSGRAHGKPL
jgi:hypothetical protein